jgi:hypothetical protein
LRHFIEELEQLLSLLLEMGSFVEAGIHHSVLALVERNQELANGGGIWQLISRSVLSI